MDNETPSDLIARRVRELRQGRGMTVADLAARCAAAGMPKLTAQALYKLEGRPADRAPRPVSVDELLILAFALDIAPVHLIVGLDDETPLPAGPGWSVDAAGARDWIRGMVPLSGGDKKRYEANVPASEENMIFLVVRDRTNHEEIMLVLEGFRAMASLARWRAEHEDGA